MNIIPIQNVQVPDKCRGCGMAIEVGSNAFVDSDTGGMLCENCGMSLYQSSQSEPEQQTGAEMSEEDWQNLWHRFFAYEASCLKADLVEGLVMAESKRWTPITENYETVVSQGDRILPLGPDLDRLVSRMISSQQLQYGWPLVALDTAEGLKVAPLLVVNLAPPPYQVNSISVYTDPAINPAVIRALWTNSGDISFLRSKVSEAVPSGAVAAAKFAETLCSVMGLKCQELDPYNLKREIPEEVGVYNIAAAIITESTPKAKPIIDELFRLSDVRDWGNTGAALLFGIEAADISGRTGTPVMPWSAEPMLEDALQLIRRQALSVFNMSQRDQVDQLIVSAVANAWMDEETVLVVSDDEKKLDDLSNLARDVHEAMLVRTCCDSDLANNPKRNCTSISQVAAEVIEELRSTASSIPTILDKVKEELEIVEDIRRVAIEGATKRNSLLARKQQLEKKRVEAAKKLWSQGKVPDSVDLMAHGQAAKRIAKMGFMKKLRERMFLNGIKAKSGTTVEDFLEWVMASLSIKDTEADLLDLNDIDKYNVGSANYRWAATSLGVVSAIISNDLMNCSGELEQLTQLRLRDMRAKQVVGNVVTYLKAWASDYQTANTFFNLEAGMFDLLIMDNTHRVNLAWALPLAYRAKRVVIIGDTNSAPPSVFIDDEQMDSISRRYDFDRQNMLDRHLDYKVGSVYGAYAHA